MSWEDRNPSDYVFRPSPAFKRLAELKWRICPGCGSFIKTTFGKERYLKYFKCRKCRQPLAFAREPAGVKLYIDDEEHMGLMTSGIGGY